jgi:hypothetical protein
MNGLVKGWLRWALGERRYHRVRAHTRAGATANIRALTGVATLQELGRLHGTDKHDSEHSFAGLSYLDIYDRYLGPLRDEHVRLLEIGVKNGESLRTWKHYFHRGQIHGIDIDPGCRVHEEDRIEIAIGSQDDRAFLATAFGEERGFDIIVDDGSHVNRMTIVSFEELFSRRLNPGGFYIIEDLGCSYDALESKHGVREIWPGMRYNNPDASLDNRREDLDNFLLQKLRDLDHRSGDVLFVHFWAMTCVIRKV